MPQLRIIILAATVVALTAGVIHTTTQAARPERVTISGSAPGARGYRVMVDTRAGRIYAATVRPSGRFAISMPRRAVSRASIQLVRPTGRFFGPLVLRRAGSRAWLTLSGTVPRSGRIGLGRIVLRRDYALVRRPVPRSLVSSRSFARAMHGRPVGAGRLGYVRVSRAGSGGAFRDATSPGDGNMSTHGADGDGDGLPNNIDVDNDGDGVLDIGESSQNSSPPPDDARVFSNLNVPLEGSLNVNGSPVTMGEISAALTKADWLTFLWTFDSAAARTAFAQTRSANINCFSLRYCRAHDSTAVLFRDPCFIGAPPETPCLPLSGYDLDGDGLPNLDPSRTPQGTPQYSIGVLSRTTLGTRSPADVIELVAQTGTMSTQLSTLITVGPYFVTTPGMTRIDDGTSRHDITYPVQPGDPGTSGGGSDMLLRGTRMTITWYRPQRQRIPGVEPSAFIDMGRLFYSIGWVADRSTPSTCPLSAYSNLSSSLSLTRDAKAPLLDATADAAPSRANPLSATIDLAQCGATVGQAGQLGVTASNGAKGDNAEQHAWVRLQ